MAQRHNVRLQKLCGILIENSFKSDSKIESVVGIGLNVNQKTFDNLPKATSMSVVMHQEFDIDVVLNRMIFYIKRIAVLYFLIKKTNFGTIFISICSK